MPTPPPNPYPWMTPGSPTHKLQTSHIHPLIASARGYETLTPNNYTNWLTRHNLGNRNTKKAQFIRDTINSQDAMFMPWYSPESVTLAHLNNITPAIDTWQLRPATPRYLDGTNKPAKYLSAPGTPTILDLHPSTPPQTLKHDTIIITEGILKADAILTAQLEQNHPNTPPPTGDTIQDRQTLNQIITNTPTWIPVISIAGVHNWKNNPEWNTLNLHNKTILIAFDADTTTNPQVWEAANALFQFLSETKKTQLVQLIQTPPTPTNQHRGIDDWITDGATINQILAATTDLPPRPKGDIAKTGDWRISPDSTRLETGIDGKWETAAEVGGRIISYTNPRFPTDQEIRTGKLNAGLPPDQQTRNNPDSIVRIEINWRNPDQQIETATIEGPCIIVFQDPKDWPRWGAKIPPILGQCEAWPPPHGPEWATAIRKHRSNETQYIDRWLSMGWIPRENGNPVFSIGSQIIDADGETTLENHTPLKEEELAGASLFGVVPTKHTLGTPQYRDALYATTMKVHNGLFGSGVWPDIRIPILTLALALRPICPIPTKMATFLVGTKGSGKSWTAAVIMGFWQRIAGTWSNSRLPGGATDTAASMEHALARTPIWVADDLAPSTSRQRAENIESGMGEIIRSVHDHRGRRRMNPDGTARIVNTPRALLVVTGENEFTNQSVADRTLIIRFTQDSLIDKNSNKTGREALAGVETLIADKPVLAELTGYCISGLCALARDKGWEWLYTKMEKTASDALVFFKNKYASTIKGTGGLGTRKLEMARELFLGLTVLDWCLHYSGLTNIQDESGFKEVLTQELRGSDGAGQWYDLIFRFVLADVSDSKNMSPGISLIEGLRTVLASGKAHVVGTESGQSPTGDPNLDTALGWVYDPGREIWISKGESIGWVIEKNNEWIVLFDQRAAFNLVQRVFPDLLPPGTKQGATWSAVWAEGLAYPRYTRDRNGAGNVRATVRATVRPGAVTRGIPVAVNVLLGAEK